MSGQRLGGDDTARRSVSGGLVSGAGRDPAASAVSLVGHIDLTKLTEVWVATNAQDASLVAINHRGAQDPGYIPGPYSPATENYVDQFVDWYAGRFDAHGI